MKCEYCGTKMRIEDCQTVQNGDSLTRVYLTSCHFCGAVGRITEYFKMEFSVADFLGYGFDDQNSELHEFDENGKEI